MNKLIVAGIAIVLLVGGFFVWQYINTTDTFEQGNRANSNALQDDSAVKSAPAHTEPTAVTTRPCNEAPRHWCMEDDAIQYDVSLRAGEICQDSTGLVFRFD